MNVPEILQQKKIFPQRGAFLHRVVGAEKGADAALSRYSRTKFSGMDTLPSPQKTAGSSVSRPTSLKAIQIIGKEPDNPQADAFSILPRVCLQIVSPER